MYQSMLHKQNFHSSLNRKKEESGVIGMPNKKGDLSSNSACRRSTDTSSAKESESQQSFTSWTCNITIQNNYILSCHLKTSFLLLNLQMSLVLQLGKTWAKQVHPQFCVYLACIGNIIKTFPVGTGGGHRMLLPALLACTPHLPTRVPLSACDPTPSAQPASTRPPPSSSAAPPGKPSVLDEANVHSFHPWLSQEIKTMQFGVTSVSSRSLILGHPRGFLITPHVPGLPGSSAGNGSFKHLPLSGCQYLYLLPHPHKMNPDLTLQKKGKANRCKLQVSATTNTWVSHAQSHTPLLLLEATIVLHQLQGSHFSLFNII